MAREDLLTRTLVELADSLVVGFDVIDFLTFLATRCVELVDGDAAGILLADAQGNLQFAASSNEEAALVELYSLQHDEGPCLDCFRTGQPLVNQDLARPQTPWPGFSPVALEAGYRSVHALPMRVRGTAVGSMNIFSAAPPPLAAADLLVAQAMADVASISILQDRALRDSQLLSEQLNHALNSRVAIEQAKGVLAERHHIDMDEAFTRLRRYSRASSLRLHGVAAAVIDGSLPSDALLALPENA